MSNVAAEPAGTSGARTFPGSRYLWILMLVIGVGGGIAYYLSYDNYRLSTGIYLSAAGAVFAGAALGVVINRPSFRFPWWLIVVGVGSFVTGDFVYYVSEPLAEIPYLIGYGFLIAAFLLGARLRDGGTPFVALQDALMVTIAGFVTLWLVIVEPADLVTFDWISLIENVIFPMLDLALLTVILRSMFGVNAFTLGPRVMLFVAGLLTLFCDLAVVVSSAHESSTSAVDDQLLQVAYSGYLPAYALFSAAALHPLMNRVYMPLQPDERQPETTRLRLAVVLSAPLAPLLTAAALQFYGKLDSLLLVFLGSLVLFGLSFARLKGLITEVSHQAQVDERLRAYAEVLVGTHDREAALAAAEEVGEFVLGRDVVVAQPGEAPAGMVTVPVRIDGKPEFELAASAGAGYATARTKSLLAVIADNLSVTFAREDALEREQAALESLQAQNAQLLELDAMKEAFVSMVSHELRTPLTSIVGYMELIRDGEAGEVTEQQEAFIAVIDRNLVRLRKLVDDILALARADAGRLVLTPEELDFAQLVRRCVESAGPVADARSITLRAEIADDLPAMVGDRRLLAQLLDNLVSNGVKFTPDGGSVTIEAQRGEDRVELTVSDTGAGIPEDEVPRLFERFFRASTAGEVQGTGLGLAITKSIAEAHGGSISVESEVGVGSTFRVTLQLEPPIADDDPADADGSGS